MRSYHITGLDYTVAHYGILTKDPRLDVVLCFVGSEGQQAQPPAQTAAADGAVNAAPEEKGKGGSKGKAKGKGKAAEKKQAAEPQQQQQPQFSAWDDGEVSTEWVGPVWFCGAGACLGVRYQPLYPAPQKTYDNLVMGPVPLNADALLRAA
jgi:hypothetical protein